MSLEKLIASINEEAKKKAETIIENAQLESKKILAEAQEKLLKQYQTELQNIKYEIENQKQRQLENIQTKYKMEISKEKWNMVKNLLEEIRQAFINSYVNDTQKYVSFIKSALKFAKNKLYGVEVGKKLMIEASKTCSELLSKLGEELKSEGIEFFIVKEIKSEGIVVWDESRKRLIELTLDNIFKSVEPELERFMIKYL